MDKRKFGQTIRAMRHGYGWFQELGAFVRITDFGAEKFYVEICPPGSIPNRPYGNEHFCWWEGHDRGYRLLSMIPKVAELMKRPPTDVMLRFVIDEHGEEVIPNPFQKGQTSGRI